MKPMNWRRVLGWMVLVLLALLVVPAATPAADQEGFESLFDGKTLDGWDGNPKFWRVEDGAIVGQTTKDNPTKGNTFIVWRKGQPGDFELRLEYRMFGGNSGIQYRSFEKPDEWGRWVIGGYQADFEAGNRYSGILYGERYRGILALRGQKTVIGANHKPKVVETFGETKELQKAVKKEDWNEYRIVARGFHFTHYINGRKMSECVDEDEEVRLAKGLLALQLHQGPPMKVEFRNIRIKKLSPEGRKSKKGAKGNKIVLIAGPKSHGYAAHEHRAGCLLLAKWLEALPGVKCMVCEHGWPKDSSVLDGAAAIVIFCDGGGRHIARPHMEHLGKLMQQGVGLTCLHYGVEIPKGPDGDRLKEWTGGYFETDWSVNPHWTAEFKQFPDHPVSRGLKPFAINDEWYYHMRFKDDMEGVTPILTAIPPDSTRQRRDGPHSNNPTVRARKGMPEHVGWVVERPDSGRGFGFSGGHWHWNWACDSFRTSVLNGIAWTAKVEIPRQGVPSKRPTWEELEAEQDFPKPRNYDKQRWIKLIEEWNR